MNNLILRFNDKTEDNIELSDTHVHALVSGNNYRKVLNRLLYNLAKDYSEDEVMVNLLDTDIHQYRLSPEKSTERKSFIMSMSTTDILDYILHVAHKRFDLFSKYDCKDLEKYNALKFKEHEEYECLPQMLVVLVNPCFGNYRNFDENKRRLTNILKVSRCAGIHVIVAGPRFYSILSTECIDQFSTRICTETDRENIEALIESGSKINLKENDALINTHN